MPSTEYIWHSFHRELYAFIYRSLKDRSTSQDVLQDVFLKIHTKRHTLKEEQKLVSWVWQITRNTILDHIRTRKLAAGGTDDLPENIPATVNDYTFNRLFAQSIFPFIHNLPDQYREAIIKVDIEGMPQKQFATEHGISYTAAKSRVQRARLHLKALFLQCCAIPADKYGNILDMIPRKNCSCRERPSAHAVVSSM